MSLTIRGRSRTVFLEVHPSPSFSPKCNLSSLPFPTNPLPSICREGFFLLQNAKPPQIFPYINIHFLFYFYLFTLLLWIFSFCSKTWNSSPNWKNYSPAFGANNRRIDAPVNSISHSSVLGRRGRIIIPFLVYFMLSITYIL